MTEISYGSGGAVTITCAPPTTTVSASPSPTNTSQDNAQNLGGIGCSGAGVDAEGTISAGGSLWYSYSTGGGCNVIAQLSVASGSSTGEFGFNVYAAGSTTPINSSPTDYYSTAESGTWDIQVVVVSGGPFNYSLAISGS